MNKNEEKIIIKSIKILLLTLILIIMTGVFIECYVIHCYSFYQIDFEKVIAKCDKESPVLLSFFVINLLLAFMVFPIIVFTMRSDKTGEWRKITEETVMILRDKIDPDRLNLFINKSGSKGKLTERLKLSGFNTEEIELILSRAEETTGIVMLDPPWMKYVQKILMFYFICITLYTLYTAYNEGFHNLRIHSLHTGDTFFYIYGRQLTQLEHQKIVSYIVRIVSSYTLYALFYILMVFYPNIKEEKCELMELKKSI